MLQSIHKPSLIMNDCSRNIKDLAVIGMANKTPYLGRSWSLPNDSKHNKAGFSAISTYLL
jgi:hypothetical protein